MAQVLHAVESIAAAVREEREPYFWCLIDTLHLTPSERPGGLADAEVLASDARLAGQGGRVALLTSEPATFQRRCLDGRRDNPWLHEMLARHRDAEAMVAAFTAGPGRAPHACDAP